MSNNNKAKGVIYEYKFFDQMLSRGYELFIPAGDNLGTDCIIQNKAGEILKIQVKGTSKPQERPYNGLRYKINAATGSSNKTPIDCLDVDILAVYIEPHNLWYIIPCLNLASRKSIWFYPDNEGSTGKFESYKNAWGVLD